MFQLKRAWMLALSLVACEAEVSLADRQSVPVSVIVEHLGDVGADPEALEGICLPAPLAVDSDGETPCFVLEASSSSACTCEGAERLSLSGDDRLLAVRQVEAAEGAGDATCWCEIEQLSGEELRMCRSSEDPGGFEGWCYVDENTDGTDLLSACPPGERRLVRFVGALTPAPLTALFLACGGP